MTLAEILQRLDHVCRCGDGKFTAQCPAHEDNSRDSLGVKDSGTGATLLHCYAGCSIEAVVAAMGLEMKHLYESPWSADPRATPPPPTGCTLAAYGAAKKLDSASLKGWGIAECASPYAPHLPALRIPFYGEDGAEVTVLYRLAVSGEGKHKYRRGDHAMPYGLHRLSDARPVGKLALVEGPSDAQTCWHHGIAALGLPSNHYNDAWTPHLDGFTHLYVVVEPGQSGQGMLESLAMHGARIRDRVYLVSCGKYKDPSEMHVANPEAFKVLWELAIAAATPWGEHEARQRAAREAAAAAACGPLASCPRLLPRAVATVRALGVVRERRTVELVTLAVVSRLLDKPVSVALKGPSAAGKSCIVERVLQIFPPTAAHALTAMSERALAYDEEPIAHRMLVLYEAAGMRSDFASYLVRSLLSEGRLRYVTVEKTKQGLRPRLIEREGPTGLIVTTTAIRLHPENETRLLSVPVTDTRQQTKAVLDALAADGPVPVDLGAWHGLHEWLALGETRVSIPFAKALVEGMPPVAVRLRRDIRQVLALIRAHALLHRATRPRDGAGRIVATLADYAVVRRLVEPLVSAGVGATVPATTRETIAAVAALGDECSVRQVADRLHLDRSAAQRRVQRAVDDGYLVNREDRKGLAARLVLGDPLPEDVPVLPRPRDLRPDEGEGGSLSPHAHLHTCTPPENRGGDGEILREHLHTCSLHTPNSPETGQVEEGVCTCASAREGVKNPPPWCTSTGRSEAARHAAPLLLDELVKAGVLAAPADDATREVWVVGLTLRIEAALGDSLAQVWLDEAVGSNGRPPDDPDGERAPGEEG